MRFGPFYYDRLLKQQVRAGTLPYVWIKKIILNFYQPVMMELYLTDDMWFVYMLFIILKLNWKSLESP